MAQPHKYQGSIGKNFLDYVLEEQIEQPNNSCNCLISSVAAAEASMKFSAVMTMSGSAIASSSQPIPFSESNRNSNMITSIAKRTSIKNVGLVDETMIVEGNMLLGRWEWCQ
jgi:hypothetical protein